MYDQKKTCPKKEAELVECVICCQDINPNIGNKRRSKGYVKYSLECGHDVFHKKCIKDWLTRKSDCPLCKKEVDIKKLEWDVYNLFIIL